MKPATQTWEQGCQVQAELRAPVSDTEGELLPGLQAHGGSRGGEVSKPGGPGHQSPLRILWVIWLPLSSDL